MFSIYCCSVNATLGKGVLNLCSKVTWKHPSRNVISIELLCNLTSTWVFSCKFAVYFQTTFYINTNGGLLMYNILAQVCQILLQVSISVQSFHKVFNFFLDFFGSQSFMWCPSIVWCRGKVNFPHKTSLF